MEGREVGSEGGERGREGEVDLESCWSGTTTIYNKTSIIPYGTSPVINIHYLGVEAVCVWIYFGMG